MDQDLQYHSSEVCNLFDGGVEPENFFTVENPRQSVLPSFPYFRFVIELAERLDKHSLGYILPKYTSWWLVCKYAYSDCFFHHGYSLSSSLSCGSHLPGDKVDGAIWCYLA